jgi:hypothetical protein
VSVLMGLVHIDEWRQLRPNPTVGQIWYRQQLIREAYENMKNGPFRGGTRESFLKKARREYWLLSRMVAAGDFKLAARRICREHYRDSRNPYILKNFPKILDTGSPCVRISASGQPIHS